MKKEETTEIKPIAEVKMGHATARFSTEALEDLYYLKDFVNKDLMPAIREYDDFIIGAYRNDAKNAEQCIKLLDGLRGFVWWFERVKEIDITWESEKIKTPIP